MGPERELKARIFHSHTGYFAPGWDISPIRNSTHTEEEREAAWNVWNEAYGEVADAAIRVCRQYWVPVNAE